MNRVAFTAFLTILALATPALQAAMPNENTIFSPTVKTVLLFKAGFELSAPVYTLNSEEGLVLSFDDLSPDLKRYQYTIVHCQADWTLTNGLLLMEYIDGREEEEVEKFEYSFNTTVPYIHYSTPIPGKSLKPKISGNYLVKVYLDDPDKPVFIWRFMVVEASPVSVDVTIDQAEKMESRYSKQQVNLKINTEGLSLSTPSREIMPVVIQNDCWDNALYIQRPKAIRGTTLDYSWDDNNVFNGGNEFRSFDVKSLQYQSARVRKIEYDTLWQVYLIDDASRATKNYVSDPDINGRRLIKNEENTQNSDIEADYVRVHFFLLPSMAWPGTTVYLFGALSNWQLSDYNKMRYNPFTKKYEITLFLKQGYYDYMYLMPDAGTGYGNPEYIEGNHWETENQYMVLVYLRELAGYYDRLIGISEVNTRSQQ
jgi:hypothetical protein